jgi:hypothetical protein
MTNAVVVQTAARHKFPGRGQRNTTVLREEHIIPVLTRLDPKFPGVATLIKAVNTSLVTMLNKN